MRTGNLSLKDLANQLTLEEACELVARVLAAQDHKLIHECADDADNGAAVLRAELISGYQEHPLQVMIDNENNQRTDDLIREAMERVAPEYKLPSDFK